MAVNTTQGIVLAVFGASAGGHLTSLDANATANGNASLATDLSATAGLILGVDLSTDAAFVSTVLANLGIEDGTDGYTLASNYFTTNLAAGAGRGDLVAAAVEYLLGDNVDASLSTVATTFTTTVTDAVTYSQGEGAAVFGVAELIAQQGGSEPAAPAGASFVLTSAADTLTGDADDNTFTAELLTVNDNDNLSGGDGADTLTMEINGAVTSKFITTGIETVEATSFGANSIDMKGMSGVTDFVNTGSTGAVTLNNVSSASMALSYAGTNTNSTTANYVAGTLSGSADTLNINLDGATTVTANVDAGYESAAITSSGTSSFAATTGLVTPGVDTLTVAVTDGTLTLADSNIDSVLTMVVTGAGDLKVGTQTGVKTISATAFEGSFLPAATVASTGLANDKVTGVAAGSSVLLGAGNDHFDFEGASSAGKSDTVKGGAGNDTLEVKKGSGTLAVFGEAGDDTIYLNSTTAAGDVVDGGAGTNAVFQETGNLVATLKNVSSVTLGQGTTLDASNATGALTVDADAGTAGTDTAVSATGLTAGSTVTVTADAAATTGHASSLAVGYTSTEAAATIDVDVEVAGAIDVTKVTDLTLDFAKAATATGADLTIDDTVNLTITAAKALDLTGGISSASTDKLATITVTGSDAVDLDAIANSDKLTTLAVSSAKALTIGALEDTKALDTVTLNSGKGVAGVYFGETTAADDLTAVTIDAADGDVVLTAGTDGDTLINAKELGTVTINANAGDITGTDGITETELVAAADSAGITVNLSAKSFISATASANTAGLTVVNTKGDITATLGGTAEAHIDYTVNNSANTGVVNLTATNTGGLTTTITNDATADDGSTSTIALGNAKSGATNAVTLNGTVDVVNITGGSGVDTVAWAGTDVYAGGTINLGGGVDTLDFTNVSALSDASAYTGVAVNLGSQDKEFVESSTDNNTTVASGTARAYDDNGTKKLSTDGWSFTLNNIEKIIGTGQKDYLEANNTGTTFTGAGGADDIVLGAGSDTVIFSASGSNGADVITSFTAGADGDVLNVNAQLGASATVVEAPTTGTATDNDADQKVVLLKLASNKETDLDDAAEVAAFFGSVASETNHYFWLDSHATDKEAVVLTGAADDTTVYVWDVTNTAIAGVESDEVTLIGTVTLASGDIDSLVSGNFSFSA